MNGMGHVSLFPHLSLPDGGLKAYQYSLKEVLDELDSSTDIRESWLKNNPGTVLPPPHSQTEAPTLFCSVKLNSLYELMYKDPSRWAHTFQAYVQMTMLEHHLQSTSLPVKLIERSVYSGRYCFVENLFRSGKLLDAEFSVYCEWFRMITQHVNLGVDLIVYMRTDPCKLHDRIRKRSRSEEQTIPIQYLEDLHRLHEEWLIEKKYPLPCPVLVLDANDSLPVMYKKFEEHTSDILCKKLVEGSVMGASVITQPSSPVKAVV